MKNIAIIITYFGKLPDYFDLWLSSAKLNNKIDFLFFTDCDIKSEENIIVFKTSFDSFKKRIQTNFDFEICLDKPYKLCDYRPAFGLIFANELKKYDYWGHMDIDTILGDIYSFVPNEDYEKIFKYGHLSLYKNTKENNERFMKNGGLNYRDVFQTSFNMIFDELIGIYKKFKILNASVYENNCCADIARRRANFTLNTEVSGKNYSNQIFYYNNGHVYRDYYQDGHIITDEFAYIHFSHRNPVDKTNSSNSYFITRFGFIKKENKTTLSDIKELNGSTPILNIGCTFNTQVIRRIKRVITFLKSKANK